MKRAHLTLQDRLVKKLRLRNISTVKAAQYNFGMMRIGAGVTLSPDHLSPRRRHGRLRAPRSARLKPLRPAQLEFEWFRQ